MQPDLPWNVAGIPPEAREAARAAARREGLSVGEWLTRRILRSLMDMSEPDAAWQRNGKADHRASVAEEPSVPGRDTEEMLARVSRSETESNSVNRKIEEQLRGLSRRLEATERTQTENSRAVSQAATEINIATREQAQAFDQLGTHVVSLGERIARVEHSAATDGIKEAVKGLHAGLSRLADQIAETANQSGGQIAALAGNVESVAEKLNEARSESENSSHTLAARIAGFEERVRAVETMARTAAEQFDKTVANIESAQRVEQSESHRQALVLTQVGDTLDKLTSRITTSEAQNAGAIARLEDQIAKVESRQGDAPFDRRLQGIEHALSDIVGRLESTERSAAGTARSVEENLRNLSTRLDASDTRNREALVELRTALTPAPVEVPQPPAPPPPSPTAVAGFDLPPFPDPHANTFQQPPPPFAAAPMLEQPPFAAAQPGFAGEQHFPADGFVAGAAQAGVAAASDSYIAAARRSAREAAAADALPGSRAALGGFTWGTASAVAAQPPKSGSTRFLLVAGIVVIAVGAVVAGILLSRGFVASTPLVQPPVPTLHTTASEPPPPAVPSQDVSSEAQPTPAASAPATVPGSPVIAPRHVPPTKTAHVEIKQVPPVQTATRPSVQTAAQPAVQIAAPQQTQAKTVSTSDRLMSLAAAGSAKAELLVGLKYLDGEGVAINEAEAAKWLERAANQGEAIAAYRLGTLYERGHGVPADTTKAMQWYAAAAKLGNRKAMHNLAVAYAQGSGTQKDLTQAAQWFSKAAALGLADSQFNLAVLYERGMGVQQSLIDAYKWYAIAAAQGDSESKTRLDVISTQLSADERAAAQKAAADFRPLPLERNANMPPDPSAIN